MVVGPVPAKFYLGGQFLDDTKNKLQSFIEFFPRNSKRWCDTNGILCEQETVGY